MTPQQLAIFLCFAVVIMAICAVWFILEARARLRDQPSGRHTRAYASDADESVWQRALHHQAALPVTGWLPMLPPDPPPADTTPLPVVVCELGMPTEEYVEQLFRKHQQLEAAR